MSYSKIEIIAYERGYRVDKAGYLHSPTKGIIVPAISNTGYYTTGIRIGKRTKHLRIHRLQAYQKYGDEIYSPIMVVRHLDGNPLNNSFENIEIGTSSQNRMDIPESVRKRTALEASSYITVYNQVTVGKIKEYKKTHGYKDTMQKFGISSKGTLWNILNKR